MAVDQSRTQWNPAVKNAAGKVVKKGYLSQYGRPEKRVTGKVKLVTETGGKRAGQTQKYSAGRKIVSNKPAFGVGGSNPSARKPNGGSTGGSTGSSTGSSNSGGSTSSSAATKAADKATGASDKSKKMSYQTGSGRSSGSGASSRSAAQAAAFASANKKKKPGVDYRSVAAANRKDSASAMNRRTSSAPSKANATVSESIPDIRNFDPRGYVRSRRIFTAEQKQKNIAAARRRAAADAKVLAALKARKGKK